MVAIFLCVMRKMRSIILSGTGVSMLLLGLTACRSVNSADTPAPGKVTLRMNVKMDRENYSIVKKAYVYPPLKIDEKGALLEQLTYAEDSDGNLQWKNPSSEAGEIRAVIESKLSKRGFRIVPFREILSPHNGYSILIFNAYYTPVLSENEERQVKVLFTRLSGVLLPSDLDVTKKQERISQEALVRFNSSDETLAAIKTSFQKSVEYIGQTGQWMETGPLLSEPDHDKGDRN